MTGSLAHACTHTQIIRMLNSEFNAFCPSELHRNLDLYPVDLRPAIDELNECAHALLFVLLSELLCGSSCCHRCCQLCIS